MYSIYHGDKQIALAESLTEAQRSRYLAQGYEIREVILCPECHGTGYTREKNQTS